MERRLAGTMLGVLAVVVLVLCAIALRGSGTSPAEAQPGTPTAVPSTTTPTTSAVVPRPVQSTDAAQCANIRAHIERAGLVEDGSGPSDIAVIGDSYTAGLGLADPNRSWARQVAGHLSGIGGTGFVNGGPCGNQNFDTRVNDVLATTPRVLIVQGGLNDTAASPAQVTNAAEQMLDLARDVKVVLVVGPPDVPARTDEPAIDAALSKAAQSRGRQYLSLLDVKLPLQSDQLHPTEKGQAAIADRVTAALAS